MRSVIDTKSASMSDDQKQRRCGRESSKESKEVHAWLLSIVHGHALMEELSSASVTMVPDPLSTVVTVAEAPASRKRRKEAKACIFSVYAGD